MSGVVWSRAGIDAQRLEVARTLAAAGAEPQDRLAVAIERASGGAPAPRRFLYACAALELHEQHGGLTPAQVAKLSELAMSLLRVANVNPTTSKLSFLFGELHEILRRLRIRDGQHGQALWDLHVAHQLSRKAPLHDDATRLAQAIAADVRLGLGESALARLRVLEELAGSGAPDATRLFCMRVRWLTGDDVDPGALGGTTDGAWLGGLQAIRAGAGQRALLDLGVDGDAWRCLPYEPEAWLLCRALYAPDLSERLRGPKAMRDAHKDAARRSAATDALLKCVADVEQLADADRPLHQRLRIAQLVFDGAQRFERVEAELLARCAVARWLVDHNQTELAASVVASYRAFCRSLTVGRREDLLGIFSDVDLQALARRHVRSGSA